jgi:GNAT superfamily N-acetyltransferase
VTKPQDECQESAPGEFQVRIRPLAAGDGDGCAGAWLDAARFYAAMDPDSFQIPSEVGLADWFEQYNTIDDPDALRLAATVEDELAGFVIAELQAPLPDADRQMVRAVTCPGVYVSALVVAERYRRSGIGTALMTAVEQWAASRGANLVSLDTNLRSPLSVPFYENRMGYTRHAIIFRKTLGHTQ